MKPNNKGRNNALMDSKELFLILQRDSRETILEEVRIILKMISPEFDMAAIFHAFETITNLFDGKYPGYRACNTAYHDLGHTLTTFLAMTRLIHGALIEGEKISEHYITLGLISALFHDAGYIQEQDDTEGTGAKYTTTHVQRSMDFLKKHGSAHRLSLTDIEIGRKIILCTDTNIKLCDIIFASYELELLGKMLAVADINAQMADRMYLEKLLYLYQEFKEGNISLFESKEDLLKQTIGFYDFIAFRLKSVSDITHRFFKLHFSQRWQIHENLYAKTIQKHRIYLEKIMKEPDPLRYLKRGGIVDKILGAD
jgi:hypothetical protein